MAEALRSIARVGIFPAFVAALAALAAYADAPAFASAVGLAPEAGEGLLFAVTVVGGYALIALLEGALTFLPEWRRAKGDVRTDWAHLLLTGVGTNQVAQAAVGALGVAGAAWLAPRVGGGLWPGGWPPLAQLALAVLITEFGHYWFHRLSHENGLVWRVHAAHHSARRLYWLNATRFHPIDLFCLIFCQSLPLLLLGIPPRAFLAYALFAAVYGQLQHCNVDLRTGPVGWIFATPELHRWHHSPDPAEGNNNYGAILIVWDVLFGTRFAPRNRRFDGTVGLDSMPDFPQSYLGQLASPFRWPARERRA